MKPPNQNSVALVNFCLPSDVNAYVAPPQGLSSIASVLFEYGIIAKIYDIPKNTIYSQFTLQNLHEYFSKIKEKYIGISLWDSILPKAILLIQKLKQDYPDKIIFVGGPSASSLYYEILHNFPFIDYCVVGEGEFSIKNLIEWIDSGTNYLSTLSNQVYYNDNGKIISGQLNLRTKTIPELNYKAIELKGYNRFECITSRGCPFKCDFCSVNNITGKIFKKKEIQKIIAEVNSLNKLNGNFNRIHFLDDNFGLNKKRLNNLIEKLHVNFPHLKWSAYFRVDDLTPAYIDYLESNGCYGLFLGIESGNDQKLKNLRKAQSTSELKKIIEYGTKKLNLTLSFIWGFPDETYDEFIDTVNFAIELSELDNIYINLYQLTFLSGTKLTAKHKNLAFDINYISNFLYPDYLPQLDNDEISLIRKYPNIFSAFYHLDSEIFVTKHYIINQLLNKNTHKYENAQAD